MKLTKSYLKQVIKEELENQDQDKENLSKGYEFLFHSVSRLQSALRRLAKVSEEKVSDDVFSQLKQAHDTLLRASKEIESKLPKPPSSNLGGGGRMGIEPGVPHTDASGEYSGTY